MLKVLVIFFSLLVSGVNAQQANWETLFDHAQYQNAKISPDGKYLAVAYLVEGKTALAILDFASMKSTAKVTFRNKEEIGHYSWANNERLVININQRVASLEQPQFLGELFAVNYDGTKRELIYGYRTQAKQTGTRLKKKKAIFGWAEIIDILPEDEQHILISSTPMSNTGEKFASVLKLNIYNGKVKSQRATAPLPFSTFLTDKQGKVKALVGIDKNADHILYLYREGKWNKVIEADIGKSVTPISISPSGKYLYTFDSNKQDLVGIFRLNLDDFSYKEIFTDKSVDITYASMTTDGRTAYAVRVDDGYPSYILLNKKLEEAKVFKSLLKVFPYSKVAITSKTDDGDKYIVLVSSDIEPGSLYLYDKKQSKLSFLFKSKPAFNKEQFFKVEPIKFTSSDGLTINGYFTEAKSKEKGQIAPLVILVHGGPHGVRDHWSYSDQVQYLAANGFSVLQVNYRGSGGYGNNFEIAGYKSWGTTVQQDILEAYNWLVKEKKANAKQACIMGGSFGAYSAIQSAAIYPDSYKCAIANAGIYDLKLMFEEGDIQQQKAGMSYLKKVLGTDDNELKSISPVNYVNKINIPLLLAHGEDDERAPFEHFERLKEALDKADKDYDWFVIDKEGHGFYNPENQKAYMKKVVEFLSDNLE